MVDLTKGNTMTMQKKRGLLAAASAALTALALTFSGAASAAPNTPANPPETSDVTITKLTQPDAVGAPADGGRLVLAGRGRGRGPSRGHGDRAVGQIAGAPPGLKPPAERVSPGRPRQGQAGDVAAGRRPRAGQARAAILFEGA